MREIAEESGREYTITVAPSQLGPWTWETDNIRVAVRRFRPGERYSVSVEVSDDSEKLRVTGFDEMYEKAVEVLDNPQKFVN